MDEQSRRKEPGETGGANGQVDRLATAFRDEWRHGREPRIEAFMAGVVPEEREPLFGELLRIELGLRRGRGERLSPDRYLSRFTEYCDQVTDAFAYVEATVLLEPASLGDGAEPGLLDVLPAPEDGSEDNRYSDIRLHAVGGLGEVYVAQDRQLNRKVALKRLRPRSQAAASAGLRFLREAEMTGRLEHPGVVPIYGLGHDDGGLPYYVMRFIEGATLADAIKAFHSLDAQSPERTLELAKLLRRFLDVCHAIDFAHSRGVLHRDLKPANVMLGEFGETLVVDWGLAKLIGATSRPAATGEATDSTGSTDDSSTSPTETRNAAEFDIGRTEFGTIVGTLGYMSPEQARGQNGELTPATDVFSLGAILFCLLTGRSPTPKAESAVMLRYAQTGTTDSIDEFAAAVPRPLRAICRKALASEPADRYLSAGDLADDVERWLADEPLAAYRETPLEVAARWIRRHRTAVMVAVAFSAALAAVSTIGMVAVEYQRRQTEQQREIAEQQRAAAETARALESRERQRAEQTTYAAQIQAADASWNSNQSAAAWRHLNSSDKARRGWEHAYLVAKFQHDLPVLADGFPPFTALAADRDGGRLFAAGRDGYVRLWDTTTRREIWSRKCFKEPITAAAADFGLTHYAAARGTDAVVGTIHGAGAQVPIRGHEKPISAVEFLSASLLVTAGEDGTVRLWDVADGRAVRTIPAKVGALHGLAVARDGSRIAAFGSQRALVWNASDGKQEYAIPFADTKVLGLALSHDGRRLAVATSDSSLRLIELKGVPEVPAVRKFGRAVNRVAFGPVDGPLISAGYDGLVRIHDGRTLVEVRTFRGHTAAVAHAVQSDDGKHVFSAGLDGSVRMSHAGDPALPRILRGAGDRVTCAAFLPGSARLVSGDAAGNLCVWDTDDGTELRVASGYSAIVNCLAVAADGKQFVSGGDDGRILLWDRDGRRLAELGHEPTAVLALTWRDDGRTLLVGGADGTWKIWDVESRSASVTLPPAQKMERAAFVVVAPKRNAVLFGDHGNSPRMEFLNDNAPTLALTGHEFPTLAAAVSADGSLWATGGMDAAVKLWNAQGREVAELKGHTNWITAVTFSPDGRRLATSALDGTIKIWDRESSAQLLTLDGHEIGVSTLVFSPDGRRLASACNDGTLKVWIAANETAPAQE